MLFIEKYRVGAYGGHNVYGVCSELMEVGNRPNEIIRVDSLELAALILRYLQGFEITESEAERVKEALRKADAPTDQSKRAR